MHEQSDVQLLRDYAKGGQESAFRELVDRHADLVYSAALRQVNSPDVAADVAQSVFTDLARKARKVAEQMSEAPSLAGWLHRSTRYAALNHWRDSRRRLANEKLAMEQLLTNAEAAPDWESIRPLLDEALDSLDDQDREAILLRYFKNQDFRAVGLALGISDDAAQKQVSRAVERLREFFSKRKVTIGSGVLAALISANAVQSAPAGLAVALASAAVASGTVAATSTAIAASKLIAMTTLQKTIITAAFALVAGAGLYEARQATQLRKENQTLRQQQAEQLAQLQRERDDATNRLASLSAESSGAKKIPSEVLKLRGEVGALRQEKATAESKSPMTKLTADPEIRKAFRDQQKKGMSEVYSNLAKQLKWTPEQTQQFTDLLADHIWDSMELATQVLQEGKSQAEIKQIFAASDAALQQKVRALIGDDAFNQYQDYTKNLGSTLFVDDFAGSLTGDPTTVMNKKSQLLQAMKEATQSEVAAAGLPADYQTLTMLNFANFASEAEEAQSLQLKDKIFGDVAASASNFLSADELNKFQQQRTNAIAYTQYLISMNRKLLAPIGH